MSLRKDVMIRNLGSGLPPMFPSHGSGGGHTARRGPKDYTPLSWKDYFDSCQDIEVPEVEAKFRVYLSGFEDGDQQEKPLLVLLHGGGYSGLSWSTFVKSIHELVHVKVVAIDIRGHGSTETANDDDLSIETLAHDVGLVIQKLVVDDETRIVLMGHSMGGAIAVRCSVLCKEVSCYIAGLVVIDVVEGTALEALQGMQCFLRGRPKEFPSLENAIEWSVRSGQTKNLESARVSMPSQLTPVSTSPSQQSHSLPNTNPIGIDSINEDEDEDEETDQQSNSSQVKDTSSTTSRTTTSRTTTSRTTTSRTTTSNITYKFRVDLTKSENYWRGWFEGLSDQFLSSPSPAKLLLLAGIDRLDRPLTIGQMQGKFQMHVLTECGHAVHEDVPDKVCPCHDMVM